MVMSEPGRFGPDKVAVDCTKEIGNFWVRQSETESKIRTGTFRARQRENLYQKSDWDVSGQTVKLNLNRNRDVSGQLSETLFCNHGIW